MIEKWYKLVVLLAVFNTLTATTASWSTIGDYVQGDLDEIRGR